MSISSTKLALVATTLLLPLTRAHMALWHPSAFGFSTDYEIVVPLSGKSFNEWWFHGYLQDTPSESMSITPGSDLTVEIACSKSYSSFGNSPSSEACPSDSGSYHAGGTTGSGSGWEGNSEDNLMGCALAIAFNSDASSVKPEDFIIMSTQERCVRQRDTTFSIPSNLPSCPQGGCTCAWFWQGQNSANEMYMTGFKCDVNGGINVDIYPKPEEPRRGGDLSGPTQPMYWANSLNDIGYEPDYSSKPSYNSAFGWKNGAQTGAFEGLSGSGNGDSSKTTEIKPTTTSETKTKITTDTDEATSTSTTHEPGWREHAAQESTGSTEQSKTCKRGMKKRWRRRLSHGPGM